MVRVRESLMVGVAAWTLFVGVICQSALGRDVKLTIYPQKVSADAGKYLLLPPPASLTDADALPLYDKAIKALPSKATDNQVQRYLKMSINELPTDKAEQTLKAYVESLKYVAQAAKCRECKWPASLVGAAANEPAYARLGWALRLWAHCEISQGNHAGAVLAMQTTMGMGKHLSHGPNEMQFLTAVGTTAAMCREIEGFVQTEDSPNLYVALAALPRLTPDAEKIMDSEKKTLAKFRLSEPPTGMTRVQFESELKQAEDRLKDLPGRLHFLAKRFDRDLTLLQSVEAIRSYAASHEGQLPQTLAEITEISVPKDPMSGQAFRYTRTGATAVLESPTPAGSSKEDAVRYEITVKK